MEYGFPIVTSGYRWNLLKRCQYEVGLEPTCISDVGEQTVIAFERELTAQELSALSALMEDSPQNPPNGMEQILIKDLDSCFEQLKADSGLLDLQYYFVESQPGSGVFDRIALCHEGPLAEEQKLAVKNAYFNLFIG